jgi:ribosomal subunit interface protein
MKVTFSARHFEPSQKLQDFATEEISRLGKYLTGKYSGDIVLEENGNLKTVDIRLNAMGRTFQASVEENDFYKIIPKAVIKLEKQLMVRKSKVQNR